MTGSLQGVRRRLEALDRSLVGRCRQQHTLFRIDLLDGGEDLPAWPEAEDASQHRIANLRRAPSPWAMAAM